VQEEIPEEDWEKYDDSPGGGNSPPQSSPAQPIY